MKLYAVDPGNRWVKHATPGSPPGSFESISALVLPSQKVSLNKNSIAVTYTAGTENLVGKTWVAGSSAHDYQGQRTYLKDKADVIPLLVLAAIEPPADSKAIDLQALYISHPQPDLVRDRVEQALVGIHQYTRHTAAGAIDLTLRIQSVTVLPEGHGSIQIALRRGLLAQAEGGYVGCLDIGGGTVIGSLWQGDREIAAGRVVLEKAGSYGLADRIAKDPRMQQMMGGRGYAKADLIMDGIAAQTFYYGRTGTDYRQIFEDHKPLWWQSITDEITAAWSHWIAEVDLILVTGGAAPLLTRAIESSDGWLQLCPDAQIANVLGMLPTASEPAAKVSRMRAA